jgi:hypothetical protein
MDGMGWPYSLTVRWEQAPGQVLRLANCKPRPIDTFLIDGDGHCPLNVRTQSIKDIRMLLFLSIAFTACCAAFLFAGDNAGPRALRLEKARC